MTRGQALGQRCPTWAYQNDDHGRPQKTTEGQTTPLLPVRVASSEATKPSTRSSALTRAQAPHRDNLPSGGAEAHLSSTAPFPDAIRVLPSHSAAWSRRSHAGASPSGRGGLPGVGNRTAPPPSRRCCRHRNAEALNPRNCGVYASANRHVGKRGPRYRHLLRMRQVRRHATGSETSKVEVPSTRFDGTRRGDNERRLAL